MNLSLSCFIVLFQMLSFRFDGVQYDGKFAVNNTYVKAMS